MNEQEVNQLADELIAELKAHPTQSEVAASSLALIRSRVEIRGIAWTPELESLLKQRLGISN
jgi:hypothetical protein